MLSLFASYLIGDVFIAILERRGEPQMLWVTKLFWKARELKYKDSTISFPLTASLSLSLPLSLSLSLSHIPFVSTSAGKFSPAA